MEAARSLSADGNLEFQTPKCYPALLARIYLRNSCCRS